MLLFILFLLVERRASEPILPLSLFRTQVFSVPALLKMLQMMVLLGLSLYLPLSLQGVLARPIIGLLKRYQFVTVLGALLMGTGSYLLMLMTPETGLGPAYGYLFLATLRSTCIASAGTHASPPTQRRIWLEAAGG